MLDMLIRRLDQLKQDHESGVRLVKEKEDELVRLREQVTRIVGSIQTLEEVIEEERKKKPEA